MVVFLNHFTLVEYHTIKAKNLHVSVCSLHNAETVYQIDFKLEDLRMCMCAFDAVWICKAFYKNWISTIFQKKFNFTSRATSSAPWSHNTDSANFPFHPRLYSKVNCTGYGVRSIASKTGTVPITMTISKATASFTLLLTAFDLQHGYKALILWWL